MLLNIKQDPGLTWRDSKGKQFIMMLTQEPEPDSPRC